MKKLEGRSEKVGIAPIIKVSRFSSIHFSLFAFHISLLLEHNIPVKGYRLFFGIIGIRHNSYP